MSDQDIALGGEDVAPQESDLREPYDESMGDVGISREEYEQMPGWKRGRLSEMNEARRKTETELAEERGQRRQLEQRLAQFENQLAELRGSGNGNGKAEPEKKGWAAFETEKLDGYLADYARAQREYLANPDNEEAKSAFFQYDPRHIDAVRDEKARRIAAEMIEGVESKRGQEREKELRNARFQQSLIEEFGPDVGRPKSELMQMAVDELRTIAQTHGLTEEEMLSDHGYQHMAVDRAYRKLHGNRGGRDDVARRHLAVEAGVRREAASANTIAALRQKGDWKSKDKAKDIEISEFLKHNFPDVAG